MSSGLHKDQGPAEAHGPFRKIFADASERTGDTGPYTSTDVDNKIRALQVDTLAEYVLTATTPVWSPTTTAGAPAAHAPSHHSSGDDALTHDSIAGSGTNSHAQIDSHIASTSNPHSTSHADLGGVTANQHHNEDHKARHVSGGDDTFASTDLLEAIVKRLRESGGPTDLLLGAIADGEFLKRSGSGIVGDTGGSGVGPITSLSQNSIATQSSVGTWSVVSGMVMDEPDAGNYTVFFWANMEILGADDWVDLAIFVDGVQMTNSECRFLYDDYQASRGAAYLMGRIATVDGTEDIDIRLQTEDSTGVRWRDRRILLIKE